MIRADGARTAFYPGGAFGDAPAPERDAERETSGASETETETKENKNVPTWQAAQSARLTRALVAYALRDPKVGYCQGMNEVAARFLENVVDESEAFWCFAAFLEAYRPTSSSPTKTRRPAAREKNANAREKGKNARSGVRDVLRDLGVVLRRCDPPLWKHVRLLNAQECMFAFRAVVVLLARELPPPETTFLWEALMASGDHLVSLHISGDARDGAASPEAETVSSDARGFDHPRHMRGWNPRIAAPRWSRAAPRTGACAALRGGRVRAGAALGVRVPRVRRPAARVAPRGERSRSGAAAPLLESARRRPRRSRGAEARTRESCSRRNGRRERKNVFT